MVESRSVAGEDASSRFRKMKRVRSSRRALKARSRQLKTQGGSHEAFGGRLDRIIHPRRRGHDDCVTTACLARLIGVRAILQTHIFRPTGWYFVQKHISIVCFRKVAFHSKSKLCGIVL